MPNLRHGSNLCQCGACGEYFNSVGVFDKHRIGPHTGSRSCKTISDMVGAGWSKSSTGFWMITENNEVNK